MYTDKNKVFIPSNIQKLLYKPHIEVESPNDEYKIIDDKNTMYRNPSTIHRKIINIIFKVFRKINEFKRIEIKSYKIALNLLRNAWKVKRIHMLYVSNIL